MTPVPVFTIARNNKRNVTAGKPPGRADGIARNQHDNVTGQNNATGTNLKDVNLQEEAEVGGGLTLRGWFFPALQQQGTDSAGGAVAAQCYGAVHGILFAVEDDDLGTVACG